MAQLSHVLLFDPDPTGLEVLTQSFESDGVSVTATGDPAKLREHLNGLAHGLLVVVLREPDQIGLDLVRGTTTAPKTRNLGCVVVGRDELRPAAQSAGAFTFLSAPLFTREVLGACRLAAAAIVPGSRPSPDADVTVQLAVLGGVHHLVRTMNAAERSAIVELRQGNRRGELRFVDGALRSAQLGPLQSFAALHHLLLWDDAEAKLRFKNVARRGDQFSMKRSEVLEDCERFLRDFAHEVKAVGVGRTVFAARPDRASAAPTDLAPVLRLFDGHRTFAQVIDDSPFRVFDTVRATKRLTDAGVIAIASGAPGPSAAASSGPGLLDAWFGRATPPLGAEVGGSGAPATGAPVQARVSSPFVSVAQDDKADAGNAVRQRTITRPQRSASAPNAATVPASATTAAANANGSISVGGVAGVPSASTTAPMVVGASAAGTAPATPEPANGTGRHKTLVARGEITVARPTTRQTGPVIPLDAPKVMVEIEPAAKRPTEPSPSVIVALTPPPEGVPSARQSSKRNPDRGPLPGGGGPGPIVFRQDPAAAARVAGVTPPLTPISPAVDDAANIPTPPPELTGAPPAASHAPRASGHAPHAATAPANHIPAPAEIAPTPPAPTLAPAPAPSVVVNLDAAVRPAKEVAAPPKNAHEPTTAPIPRAEAAPVVAPPEAPARPVTPAPVPVPAAAASESDPHRNGTPAHGFDALESDFFAREADLYKGEGAVESFDDLDGKPKGPRRR